MSDSERSENPATPTYRRPAERIQYIVLGVITSLLIAGTAVLFYLQNSEPRVTYSLTSFEVVSDTTVSVTWQMTRPAQTATYCVIRAQNDQRQDVGYATVTVAAGAAVTQMSYRMATESRATTAEVLGCSVNENVRAPQPNFAPGVVIPSQAPPGVAPKA